jgi:hypothetical protein
MILFSVMLLAFGINCRNRNGDQKGCFVLAVWQMGASVSMMQKLLNDIQKGGGGFLRIINIEARS